MGKGGDADTHQGWKMSKEEEEREKRKSTAMCGVTPTPRMHDMRAGPSLSPGVIPTSVEES
jgi:hypothetical protein